MTMEKVRISSPLIFFENHRIRVFCFEFKMIYLVIWDTTENTHHHKEGRTIQLENHRKCEKLMSVKNWSLTLLQKFHACHVRCFYAFQFNRDTKQQMYPENHPGTFNSFEVFHHNLTNLEISFPSILQCNLNNYAHYEVYLKRKNTNKKTRY